jgi:hypothetical protein
MLRSIMIPTFHRTHPNRTPNPTQMIVDNAGTPST